MVVIKHIAPSVEDYLKLRLDAGLSAKSTEAAKRGLPNACFNVTLYYESSLIGMGRIVGDEGTALQIVDIAVHPDYQGQGYGRTIMEHIMQYVHENAVKGTYVSLMADYPADKLYEKFGFQSTEPHSIGMYILF
ncbi:GNAT family N-acetyltransferase [Staphylococcus warneri]|uniref:GNAT family N-acetyltransferase n=1 Tax=Staphylococcus warneri TaxID=1292 RepID=A0A2T4Q3H8_STAWA|nr:GNAT family N-acetyltransferase [Staphylococcus warneri]PTI14628.1 GNAT family N-acetyltransferase [Staphylococcus warneri]PTI16707.1 GNAT family N-acetyltransferase [Staphylococcus warneri]PTI22753.1 GNAT family N-acetyltransferase [Staphylococcus warneri]PTI34577.1 GNAT family N-acetyltransferase [Staphylococcus warneri]PTI52504.1 GNAT family N-acetyltransferase [Staphylococcus warneri]